MLTIFHFNDVYDLQPNKKQNQAGAAYFNSLLQKYKSFYSNSLTFFSGDVFSPSLLSAQYKGVNMIKPLNCFGIDLACFGNHDLDYQLSHVQSLIKRTNFPWLLSNVYDKRTKRRLAEGLQYQIFQRCGIKIGVFSLAEKEWIDTLLPSYKQICQYLPFVDFAIYIVQYLRVKKQCTFIIALTHMMKYNDIKLANEVQGIDIILGGHDHLIVHEKIKNTILIKSGSNFKSFTIIQFQQKNKKWIQQLSKQQIQLQNIKWKYRIKLIQIKHKKYNIQPHYKLNQYIQKMYKQFSQIQQRIACFTNNNIDLRFKIIRKQQSSFLQFIVSFYRHYSGADCALMNSGNFRMDCILKAGPVCLGTITNVIQDTIVLKLVPGSKLLQALQNCVSMYPNLAGRYSALSGLGFTWDPNRKPYERVLAESVHINGHPLNPQATYKIAMHSFVGQGGDGFTCFKQCQKVADYEQRVNTLIIHDIINLRKDLLDSYQLKYPDKFNLVKFNGIQYLQLDLPQPKNVKILESK